jgi:Ca2+-binding EF-hand superfamily protein
MKSWVLAIGAFAFTSVFAEPPGEMSTSAKESATPEATATAFKSLDRNSDGQLSRTEASYNRELAKEFAFLDTDGDGFLSPDEYAARSSS